MGYIVYRLYKGSSTSVGFPWSFDVTDGGKASLGASGVKTPVLPPW